ncbi:uncharacterized protein I303_100943 [Kwoniella dejecticola CBS 10117]|uniref:Uncharacterized protein n=1 Tax=Kwoniella dejecticola CBS 10117 TaxID=1296121 RepID=A0A1A6AGC1_9TREE|nr:uncharacterized protein I303_00947 [Kwoniella dejecticola CBS 10117]OBR89125.1 hypothetical protein I303_00947 [Kwoniella dejecticola CBS 10117]
MSDNEFLSQPSLRPFSSHWHYRESDTEQRTVVFGTDISAEAVRRTKPFRYISGLRADKDIEESMNEMQYSYAKVIESVEGSAIKRGADQLLDVPNHTYRSYSTLNRYAVNLHNQSVGHESCKYHFVLQK